MAQLIEIEELEQRLAAALDRLDRASTAVVEKAVAAAPAAEPSAEVAELRAALEKRRAEIARLEERNRTLKERQRARLAELEREIQKVREAVSRLDGRLGELVAAQDALLAELAAVREAAEAGDGDEGLDALARAELAALRAERAVLAEETAVLLGLLEPLARRAEGAAETQSAASAAAGGEGRTNA